METIQAKAKIEVDGLREVEKLVEALRHTLNKASSIIGQLNSSKINMTLDVEKTKAKTKKVS